MILSITYLKTGVGFAVCVCHKSSFSRHGASMNKAQGPVVDHFTNRSTDR